MLLDANGHDYHISLSFPATCLTGADGERWVRAQTLLETNVDHFEDTTGRMGEICSSVVWVEFEEGLTLGDSFSVELPHCFDEEQMLSVEDIMVCYSTLSGRRWQQVNPERIEFVPGAERAYPAVRVSVGSPGVLCVCARNDVKVKLRVQAQAYMPATVIPLEAETVVVYVSMCLPEQTEKIRQHEHQSRGAVACVGQTQTLVCRTHTMVELGLTTRDTTTHSFSWHGETESASFEVDPRFLMKREMMASMKDERSSTVNQRNEENSVDVHLKLAVSFIDLTGRKFSVTDRSRGRGREKRTTLVDLKTSVHVFPSPSPPRKLRVASRGTSHIELEWEPPESWGGCALMQYEVQIREKTLHGKELDWDEGYRGDASRCRGNIDRNVYACDLRIRVYNMASVHPSEWTELTLRTVKDEEAALALQKITRGNMSRKNEELPKKARGSVAPRLADEAGPARGRPGPTPNARRASLRREAARPRRAGARAPAPLARRWRPRVAWRR